MKRRTSLKKYQELLIRGSCEGKQELRYLEHLVYLINEVESGRRFTVKNQVKDHKGGSPLSIAQMANPKGLSRPKKPVAFFDHDGREDDFNKALDFCKSKAITSCFSNLSFDLWLILHQRDWIPPVSACKSYEPMVLDTYGLPKETDYKSEDGIAKILAKISLLEVKKAVARAEKMQVNNEREGQRKYTSGSVLYFSNPDTNIHEYVKWLLEETGVY